MRDELFAAAEAEAQRRGVSLHAFVEDAVAKTLCGLPSPAPAGNRVDFPIIRSNVPGTFRLTNDDIRRMEEDDLRTLGLLD